MGKKTHDNGVEGRRREEDTEIKKNKTTHALCMLISTLTDIRCSLPEASPQLVNRLKSR